MFAKQDVLVLADSVEDVLLFSLGLGSGPIETEIGGVPLLGRRRGDLLDADDDLHRPMPACAIRRRAMTSRWIC